MAQGAVVFFLMAIGCTGMPNVSSADMYSWTDKDGNLHFSDVPPAQGKAKKLPFQEAEHSVTEDTKDFARRWLNASSFGSRVCSLIEMQRIEHMYHEFRSEADAAIRQCRNGDKKACNYMKIPYAEAAMESPYNLQHKYLPPHFVPWAAEAGDTKNGGSPWANCH